MGKRGKTKGKNKALVKRRLRRTERDKGSNPQREIMIGRVARRLWGSGRVK